MSDNEAIRSFSVVLAERMRQAKPGEWATVGGSSIKLAAMRKAHWINDNFGCPTRVVQTHPAVIAWRVEAQKSKKQPYQE